ncbi:MAG TPA: serine hydrolase [Pseudonocardiaceae bacterium]
MRLEPVDAAIRGDAAYAATSHLTVVVDGVVELDEHYRGPVVDNVHSVTKSVLSTLVGVAMRHGHVPSLDLELPGAPGQTLRHALTMTRGVRIDGVWDTDVVQSLDGGWVVALASAPAVREPGVTFEYENGGAHLVAALLQERVGVPLVEYARDELFGPLGITTAEPAVDPSGLFVGWGDLRVSAADLLRLGQFWLDPGGLVDPAYAATMTSPLGPGGPPEGAAYGLWFWVDDGLFFAGGWGGQHVIVCPRTRAVVVTTAHAAWAPGPPLTHTLPPGWRPAKRLLDEYVLPYLR